MVRLYSLAAAASLAVAASATPQGKAQWELTPPTTQAPAGGALKEIFLLQSTGDKLNGFYLFVSPDKKVNGSNVPIVTKLGPNDSIFEATQFQLVDGHMAWGRKKEDNKNILVIDAPTKDGPEKLKVSINAIPPTDGQVTQFSLDDKKFLQPPENFPGRWLSCLDMFNGPTVLHYFRTDDENAETPAGCLPVQLERGNLIFSLVNALATQQQQQQQDRRRSQRARRSPSRLR
ncbi:MAG: hypothetical protein M1833_004589 [Piccolia ochrophora]|nr:MAG: hypothetical protein M1833_004589 [Piccolia ochrophora]